jgi:glycosyltransferase involved in cell wall biosynthesis
LARHNIMAVPSIDVEAFGLVALEGIAAGCAIAASSVGGLPEAVGPCGVLFPNGDAHALAAVLRELLTDSALREKMRAEAPRHLEGFQPEAVAKKYIEVFRSAMNR